MIEFENTVTPSPEQWKAVIFGMRNPYNSWDKSDSGFGCDYSDQHFCTICEGGHTETCPNSFKQYKLGPNDLDLMNRLRNSGTDHRKFMRMLPVMVTITAPLYWWKEFDTYKVGTVANSCSTMHKIHAKEFTLEDFSCEHLYPSMLEGADDGYYDEIAEEFLASEDVLKITINALNEYRNEYISACDDLKLAKDPKDSASLKAIQKRAWWQMIQLLPSSYNQKRTIMMNYEVLANIYKSRKNHRLDEWAAHSSSIPDSTSQALYSKDLPFGFCDWIKTLPYSELITGEHFLTHDEIMEKLDKWAKDAEREV